MNNKSISVVESRHNLDGLDVIAYPHTIVTFDVVLPSYKEKNRRVIRAYATVDMIKNTSIRADTVPDIISIELDGKSILPSSITSDDAVEVGRKKILDWAKRTFKLIIKPKIELVEKQSIYHPFVLTKEKGKTMMINVVRNTSEKWMNES